MFPIRDHNPSDKVPYVTFALIAANVAIFLIEQGLIQTRAQQWEYYVDYAFFPLLVSEGQGYSGLITHMFLHGGWMHLGGNMLFLWVFGDNMEDEFGHVGFVMFYLLSGLAAAFLQYLPDPTSQVPMVGASGAIAGVMGGYLLMFPRARVDVFIFLIFIIRIIPIPAWIVLGLWFGLQFFNGVSADISQGGVAYWAHVGGFVAGFLLTVPLWLRRGAAAYWTRTQGHPPHPGSRYEARESSVPRVRRQQRRKGPWG
jgi:membrane associated rhomboid family serine protease